MEIVLRRINIIIVLKEDECLNRRIIMSFKEGITFCYGLKGIVIKDSYYFRKER
jgi:hypothetical protein